MQTKLVNVFNYTESLGPKYACKKFKQPQIVLISKIYEKN